MILRRLSAAIRRQDWSMVVIELAIVVFGVFLGLQFGNWNERRAQKALYEEAYDRVILELTSNLRAVSEDSDSIAEALPIVQRAIADLRDCRTGPEALANVEAAFAPIEWDVEFVLSTKALDQLIANEAYLPFQSSEMRERLMELLTYQDQLQRYSIDTNSALLVEPMARWRVLAPGALAYPSLDSVIDAFESGDFEGSTVWRESELALPLEEACTDETVMSIFYGWEVNAYWHGMAAHNLISTLESDLAALGHPVGEEEE